ncbi:IclR family transcriptional regulator domain-containing protein [Sphingobium nicotianae]|uniref:Helix-turn-helix domain-containing protein n=1 Tax=Sphingobium nicotianae TaxID=2782607 RepID=A0A9X1DBU7_9SPHN|nr:IclR family transcriptional regulator C-terminal domain-containing protein [Sphingobium nicotianae]MBT2187025.1 helix-turn-helix domain-containing protein [Sphingobium nicotianae]
MIERKVKTVRALERGLQVLSEIDRRHGANLHELHLALGLPKATLLRMVVTLGKHGHIWQRLADGAFLPSARLGPGGSPDISGDEIAEAASQRLVKLSEQVAWPSAIGVPRADGLEIVETNSPLLRLDAINLGPVGMRLSYLHTATGRAYLAACDGDERAAILDRLRPAQEDPAGERLLEELLGVTRDRGYALREPFHPWPDRNWQAVRQDGRRSMAVPVMLAGRPVASINITWLQRRTETATVVQRNLGALRRTAEAISADLAARRGLAAGRAGT